MTVAREQRLDNSPECPERPLRAEARFSRARRDASEPERPHGGGACESLTFTTIQVDRLAAIWHDYYAI